MSDPVVSIVMPLYNASRYLSESIESVICQSYGDWELIIVDDCSTDGSVEIVERYALRDSRIKLHKNATNLGAAATRSAGVPFAKGSYLAFLDADDLWMDNKLEMQLQFMIEEHAAMCFTSYETIESDGTFRNIVHVPHTLDYEGFLKNTVTCSHTIMFDLDFVPRTLLEAPVADFDFSEDLAVWLQVLKTGVIARGLDSVLARNRKHAVSRSANKMRAVRRTWATYRGIEHLGITKSAYCLIFQMANAVKKRMRTMNEYE